MSVGTTQILTFDRIRLVRPRKLVLDSPHYLSNHSRLDLNLVNY